MLQAHDLASAAHQCGSSMNAIHNLLAMKLAGYAPATLYADRWSGWCSDPPRPVAAG